MLAEALTTLILLRFALRIFRFQDLRRLLLWAARIVRVRGPRRLEVSRLVWIVETAKRRCPVTSACLSEALTAEALFCQHGREAVLCIGATRQDGSFRAHAWLENAGAIVIGGPRSLIDQYRRFPDVHRFTL